MSDLSVLVHNPDFWRLIFGGFLPGLLIWWLSRLSARVKALEKRNDD